MNIIILGANQIGCTLAETLTSEANDITVVDSDANKLRELKDRIDIGTVVGHASHPEVLRRAGGCLLYTSPSPRDRQKSRMPSSA